MAATSLSVPTGAVETLDNGLGFVACVDRMQQDPALKVVNAARISYQKQKAAFDDGDRKLASFLWQHRSTSPYRHSFYTFHWKAPLFVFRQAFKYQVGSGWREYEVNGESVSLEVFDVMFDTDKGCSWNEISGRYVQWAPEFYVPRVIAREPAARQQAGLGRPARGLQTTRASASAQSQPKATGCSSSPRSASSAASRRRSRACCCRRTCTARRTGPCRCRV